MEPQQPIPQQQPPTVQVQPPCSQSQPVQSTIINTITTGTVTSTSPNVVTIPVPIVPPPEDIYTYVAVKGSLHDTNASIFGLNREEVGAIGKRFATLNEIVNGIMVKGAPMDVVNGLSQLGYKVVCSTGEAEIVWTLQREI